MPMLRARLQPMGPAFAVAATAGLLWLMLAPRTPDLAAQVYRSGLFAREGFAVWDGSWYGGHHLPGYSLLFPPLGALLGVRVVGLASAVASAVLFDRLASAHFGADRARRGVLWLAAATACDLCIGRLTFGLGVAVGLGALLALQRGRPALAAALAVACAAASPVAGLFLALAGVAVWLGAQRRDGLVVAGPALVLVAVLALLFPEGGRQPFTLLEASLVLASATAIGLLVPTGQRVLRTGAGLYALATLAAFALPTPMGSNATRLGATFAAPVLLCARPRLRPLGVVALIALGAWQWWAPVREMAKGNDDPSTAPAYYAGLERELARLVDPRSPVRLEVPFTRSHWEAVYLARRLPLARGWETQLDTKFNRLFYAAGLDPARYEAWLRRNGVGFVAVPDVPLDPSGRAEAALVRSGRAARFLAPAWSDAHWRVFRVRGGTHVSTGPARLERLAPTGFTLDARGAGRTLVRVRFTPYWRVAAGHACLAPAGGGWTAVTTTGPGEVRVAARLSAAGVFGRGVHCR